ncbi:MAG: hypothetical protein ACYSWO_24085 [Planctomycetota bacterium]|jgi:hypothetical protein
MASRFTLDPVSGIPDPPMDESRLVEWARGLTKSLQRDHVASVDRAETQVMMGYGTSDRPTTTGSRRFHFDSKTGTLSLDVEQTPEFSEWVNINNAITYQPDGLGVHVVLSSSLPFATPGTTGYFSWDEEIWDKNSYWAGGSPTEITFETAGTYAVRFEATLTGLATGGGFLSEINGNLSNVIDEVYMLTSDGAGETYDIVISYQREFVSSDVLKFYWDLSDTCTINECFCIVTPLTATTGSIGAQPILSDHGELSGLGDDDHTQYLLASAAGGRAQFASYWTDLTDGGETSLHSHANPTGDFCIGPAGSAFQIKDGGSVCRDMLHFSGTAVTISGMDYDMTIWGDDVGIGAGGDIEISTTPSSAGTILIDADDLLSLVGHDITLNSTDDIIITAADEISLTCGNSAGDFINFDGYRVTFDYGTNIYLKDSVGTDELALSKSAASALIVGDGSNGITLSGTPINLAPNNVWVNMADSGGTYRSFLKIDGNNDITFGNSTWFDVLTIVADEDIRIEPDQNVILAPGTGYIVQFNKDLIAGAAATRIGVPYEAGAPGSLANGDMWMESDGLHIYYGGAEYTVAGV